MYRSPRGNAANSSGLSQLDFKSDGVAQSEVDRAARVEFLCGCFDTLVPTVSHYG